MKCSEVQELLSAYHDGELVEETRGEVSDHIATCDVCARRVDEFKSYSDTFSQLPQPAVPPDLWAGIAAQVAEPVQRPAERKRAWLHPAVLALAASVALILGAGLWMSRHSDH